MGSRGLMYKMQPLGMSFLIHTWPSLFGNKVNSWHYFVLGIYQFCR